MDETDPIDERTGGAHPRRRGSGSEVAGLSALEDFGRRPELDGADPVGQPDFRTIDNSDDDDDLDALRRDISRLEGKVDALLAAVEVDDGDE